VLRNNRDESLQAAQDRPVDDDGPRHDGLVRGAIPQVEALRQLEVQLDRRALERPAQRVTDGNVDLGPVERAVAGIQLPLAGVVLFERLRELLNGNARITSAISERDLSDDAFRIAFGE
jgi:hypothetical protein